MSRKQGFEDDSLVIRRVNANTEIKSSTEEKRRPLTLFEYTERLHMNRRYHECLQSLTLPIDTRGGSPVRSTIAKQTNESDDSTNESRPVLPMTQYIATKRQQIREHEQNHSRISNEYDDRLGETNVESSSAETHGSFVKSKESITHDSNDQQPKFITMARYMELRQGGFLPMNLYSRQVWMTEEQREEERYRQFRKEQARKLNQLRPRLSRSMNNLTTKEQSDPLSSVQYFNDQRTQRYDTSNTQSLAPPHPQLNLNQTASDTNRLKRRDKITQLFSKSAHVAKTQTLDDLADNQPATPEQRIVGRIRRFLFGYSVEDETDAGLYFCSDH